MNDNPSKFETLPNELLLDIFAYINLKDLCYGFRGLNLRLNKLLRLIRNLSLNFEQSDSLMIALFNRQIIRLVVNTLNDINLNRFPNLRSLTLYQATDAQIRQIRFETVPHLVYLSISSKFQYSSLVQLVQDVFSNRFPSLYYVYFSRFNGLYTPTWSLSPNIKTVCIRYCDRTIIPLILVSCPNLYQLQVDISYENQNITLPLPSYHNHPLKRFIFCDYKPFVFHYIDSLLAYITNVEWIYMEFHCEMTPIHLMHKIADQLTRLRQFHCHIIVPPNTEIEKIRQIHPCFYRIHWAENDKSSGILSTKYDQTYIQV